MGNMKEAEKDFGSKDWLPDHPLPEIPESYPVPNFGMDRDISGNIENIKVAEGIVGKKWKWDGKKYKNPARNNKHTAYYEEGSKLDGDIIDS